MNESSSLASVVKLCNHPPGPIGGMLTQGIYLEKGSDGEC